MDTADQPGALMRFATAIVSSVYLFVSVAPPANAAQGVRDAIFAQMAPGERLLLAQASIGGPAKPHADASPSQMIAGELQQIERLGVTERGSIGARKQVLQSLGQSLAQRDQEVLAEFDQVEALLRSRGLPAEILQRHREAVASYKAESERTARELADIQTTGDVEALRERSQKLRERLQRNRESRRVQPLSRQLPFAAPKQQNKEPRATSREFAQLVTPEAVPGFKLAASDPHLLFMAAQATSPGAEYLASTEDVQITPEITALATRLERNPVAIYQWVRNHIDYVPTYGSVQGSARTLVTKQGNAYDTASLLIALLRASDIPARYVFGTVDVPIERVMNWLGGVQSPQAALDLLAQGGVPVRGLAQGGVIRLARMEHVWVEAYVDFFPSRGARNLRPDSWIPLDPSFKQYEYTAGVDVRQRPLPTQLTSLNTIAQQVQFDAATGRLSGLTTPLAQSFQTEAQAKLTEYFTEAEAASLAPVRDRRIVELAAPVLAASLPYSVVASSLPSASIPAAAKRAFRFDLYTSVQSQNAGSSVISFQANLAALAGKRLSLQFVPATEADRQTLASFFPAGDAIPPSQMPRTIAGYLVRLSARLMLDGVELQRADGFTLGQEIATDLAIQKHTGEWHSANNVNTAGEFMAISIDPQGVGSDPLVWNQSQTPQAMLHAAADAYWAHASEHLKVLAGVGLAVAYRQSSFGVFSTRLDTIFSYGIPRQVKFAGTQVDIDALLTSAVAFDGSDAGRINAVNQIGALGSSLENEVPQVYLGSSPTTRGASAISAIAAAVAQGQPLYEIDANNVSAALASIQQSADVESDIQNAALAGYRVRVSHSPVQIGSWTGAGYIIEDVQTGSAAYRISGGANGGSTPDPLGDALTSVGLGMLNIVIPPAMAAASQQSCDDNNNNQQQFHINWQLIIFMAILTALLLAAAGSGGTMAPAAVAAMAILIPAFLAVTSAHASTGQCAIFYPGTTGGTGSMAEPTAHIASAQGSGSPKVLTYMGTDVIEEIVDRSWYNATPQCNPAARAAYLAANGTVGACDEYPFAAVYEGGRINYGPPNNYVSLRLINSGQNSRAGAVFLWFLLRCGVSKNEKFEVRPTGGPTSGTNAQGMLCYP